MTKVKVSLGYTRNMGNFESLRVDVGVEDDLRAGETVTQATDRVYDFVEGTLVDKLNDIEKELTAGD